MRTTLFHAASTAMSSNDHIQSPVRPARPATRLATGEREEGEGGGMITTLFHAGSTTIHDHIQSPAFTRPARPHPVTRHAMDIQTTLLEVVSFFLGNCFMCPEQGTGGRGGGGAGRLQTSDPSRLCTQGEGGRGGLGGLGVYRHLTQGRLSTQGLRSVASRVHGSGFRVWASGFRFGVSASGFRFLVQGARS